MVHLHAIFLILCFYCATAEKKKCNPFGFDFVEKPISLKRFEKHVIAIKNDLNELCVKDALYKWSLKKLDDNGSTILNNVFLDENTKEMNNTLKLDLVPGADVYKTRFQVIVTLIPPEEWDPTERTFSFLVEPYDIILNLEGGEKFEYKIGRGGLLLDATQSKDESFRDDEAPMSGNHIRWKCEPEFGAPGGQDLAWKVPDEFLIAGTVYNCTLNVVRTKTPYFIHTAIASQLVNVVNNTENVVSIRCLTNCGVGNASKDTFLLVECSDGCHNETAKWKIEPDLHDVQNSAETENQTIKFKGGSFLPGDVANLTVSIKNNSAAYTLKFAAKNLELHIICIKNCHYDPRLSITLRAKCVDSCPNLLYQWFINTVSMQTIINETDNTLTIKPNAFKEGDTVSVMLKAGNASVFKTFKTRLSAPQLIITCLANCNETDPNKDAQFEAKCLGDCNHVNYKWSLTPTPKNFNWSQNVNISMNLLTIKANTFQGGYKTQLKVQSGISFDYLVLNFSNLTSYLSIKCHTNCLQLNPLEMAKLNAICEKDCDKNALFQWIFEPKIQNITYSQNNSLVEIPPKSFSANTTANVTISYKNRTYSTQVKFIEPSSVPKLRIKCIYNCLYNHRDIILFTTSCTEKCPDGNYTWIVTKDKKPLDLKSNLVTFKNNQTFKINANIFNNSDIVEISLSNGREIDIAIIKFNGTTPDKCFENCMKPQNITEASCNDKCIVDKKLPSNRKYMYSAPADKKNGGLGVKFHENIFVSYLALVIAFFNLN